MINNSYSKNNKIIKYYCSLMKTTDSKKTLRKATINLRFKVIEIDIFSESIFSFLNETLNFPSR